MVLLCIVLYTLKIAPYRLAEVRERESLGRSQPRGIQYPCTQENRLFIVGRYTDIPRGLGGVETAQIGLFWSILRTICVRFSSQDDARVWQMNIRRLTAADLVELGTVICASSGCVHDAHWEVAKESASLPNAGPGTFQTVRFYCGLHARTFCLEANVELPVALRLN